MRGSRRMQRKEKRAEKANKNRYLTLLLAMVLGVLAVWQSSPVLYAQTELATLILPVEEGVRYNLTETEYEEMTETEKEIDLKLCPGMPVRIGLETEREVDRMVLTDGEGTKIQEMEGRELTFLMPSVDLRLGIQWKEVSEEQKNGEEREDRDENAEQKTEIDEEIGTEALTEGELAESEENLPGNDELSEEVSGGVRDERDTEGEAFPEQEPESSKLETEPDKIADEEPATEMMTDEEDNGSETETEEEPDGEETAGIMADTGETEELMEEESETEQEHQETKSAQNALTSIKLISGDNYYAPEGLRRGNACTVFKKVTFKNTDGDTLTKTAFCMQPYASGPDDGHVYEKDDVSVVQPSGNKNKNIAKALFYLYGGPAWGKTASYADGSGSINLKQMMDAAGCTGTEHYYCMSHYVVSYFYLGANGKWNTSHPVDTAENNVFNEKGIAAVQDLAAEIAKLPLPETSLSTAKVDAAVHVSAGTSRSASLVYEAAKENTGTITLPVGVTLVNETAGTSGTGTVKLDGGSRFHLEADFRKISGNVTYTVRTTYAVDFTAYKLEFAGRQDMGFAYEAGEKKLTFEVEWPQSTVLKIYKTDAETGTAVPINSRYSLEGAEYGVFADAACQELLVKLITAADGTAQTALPAGTYYLKELKAPVGYETDPEVHTIQLRQEMQQMLEDQPIQKKIVIQKKDAQTGGGPQNQQTTFVGAEYTIYRDAECREAVEVMTTDETGKASSGALFLEDYYVKETKAPEGYLLDETVYQVKMDAGDQTMYYEVESKEQMIRGSLALMKYLDDNLDASVLQDLYDSGKLEHIRFILRHEDQTVAPVEIMTDRYGYAATGRQELAYGTWYLTEDPDTTPEGYQGISNAKIEIREDGAEQMYVVTNKPYQAYLCIRKMDLTSGSLIVRDTAEFQIIDTQGNAVKMPTFDGYADTFTTNARGEIQLTRALKGGKYFLVETKAPTGYKKADPLQFQISTNAEFDAPLILECRDEAQKGQLRITKIDKNTGLHCGAGFRFEIRAAEDILDGGGELCREEVDGTEYVYAKGTVADIVETDEEGIACSRQLYPGKYEVCEIASGEYYARSEEVWTGEIVPDQTGETVVADLKIENEKTALELKKEDGISGAAMAGVTFALWEKEEDQKKEWGEKTEDSASLDTDENAPADKNAGSGAENRDTSDGSLENRMTGVTDAEGKVRFENLKHHTVYCLQEQQTLPGYVRDETVYEIEVDERGLIHGVPQWVMILTNTPNTVDISKQDITGKEELSGAELIITDEKGETVASWISGDTPHRISGLPAGKYVLTEITAPKGYRVAESICFTLTDSLEVQQVTMYDALEESEPPEETETETEKETERITEKTTEKETEKQTEKTTESKPGKAPETGDHVPLIGMLFLMLCGLFMAVTELLRLIFR